MQKTSCNNGNNEADTKVGNDGKLLSQLKHRSELLNAQYNYFPLKSGERFIYNFNNRLNAFRSIWLRHVISVRFTTRIGFHGNLMLTIIALI